MTATASKAKKSALPLRRYTDLAATIHVLRTGTITLLDPGTWDDKNDARFMAEYKRQRGLKTLLALCFAHCNETYHHWRVFSHGPDGVCIEFHKDKLLAAFDAHPELRVDSVRYRLMDTLRRRKTISLDELPFLKRRPYQDEREYRAIYASRKETVESYRFEIEIGWIRRVTLSPWMAPALRESVTQTLRAIPGCKGLKVARSTLVGNSEWQAFAARAK